MKIRVSAIQMDMEFANPDKNYQKAEELIRLAAKEKPDTIVLPETWNTGFFPEKNIKELCDKDGQRTKQLLSALSKELSVNIIGGSVVNEKGGDIYNSSYIFNRQGECIAEYDKTHLFSFMHEDYYFKKGGKTTTFELDGVKCGIIICYDIRFLELVRTLTLQGIKILFVVAQWPVPRLKHWETLNLARAIENQIFSVCVNSCGTAGQTVYAGHSALIDPWGEIIAKASGKEEIITGDIDLAVVDKIRNTINVYNDRRPELYKID
ncbi:MAG: Nitrilase/cyanide hydratase and apolipoprotein N-acyltransferase [Clostridia bacterium]|nr:Nitrilase/cyanide hydratase and apolipoprotein N-acyltransferase [Clostridia bacterium]